MNGQQQAKSKKDDVAFQEEEKRQIQAEEKLLKMTFGEKVNLRKPLNLHLQGNKKVSYER